MIQVNISEIKNRLSYYLRLVRGGERIEILDRNTPLARMIHVSQAEFLKRERVILAREKKKPAVLKALMEERKTGR